jgi:hypothetical protein
MHRIVDNFLNDNDFRFVCDQLTGDVFPWFFQKDINVGNDPVITDSFFTHVLFKDNKVNSEYFDHFKFIVDAIDCKALIRFKINCYPPTEKIKIHDPHIDHNFEHKGFLLYINDNDGYTILEDGSKIESVANRALFFDASRPHQSTTATNVKARFNININYF